MILYEKSTHRAGEDHQGVEHEGARDPVHAGGGRRDEDVRELEGSRAPDADEEADQDGRERQGSAGGDPPRAAEAEEGEGPVHAVGLLRVPASSSSSAGSASPTSIAQALRRCRRPPRARRRSRLSRSPLMNSAHPSRTAPGSSRRTCRGCSRSATASCSGRSRACQGPRAPDQRVDQQEGGPHVRHRAEGGAGGVARGVRLGDVAGKVRRAQVPADKAEATF